MRKIEEDILSDPYGISTTKTSFRTTELIGPPLPRTLLRMYPEKATIDATHYLAVLYGTAFHMLCEGKDTHTLRYEQKHARSIEVEGERYDIFGTVDETQFTNRATIVTDNKTCLLRNLSYPKPEYDMQLNIYNWLRMPDNDVKLRIRYFIKDWTPADRPKALAMYPDDFAVWCIGNKNATKSCATYEEAQTYIATKMSDKLRARAFVKPRDQQFKRNEIMKKIPESSIFYKNVDIMPEESVEKFIKERIKVHINDPEAICTEEDRWNNDVRCKYYCAAVSVCPYAQKQGYKPL